MGVGLGGSKKLPVEWSSADLLAGQEEQKAKEVEGWVSRLWIWELPWHGGTSNLARAPTTQARLHERAHSPEGTGGNY